MDTYTAVKERLSQLLLERRMSVHKLTVHSAVSSSTIKNILYGKSTNPGVVTLKLICDGLGISITEFFETDAFQNLDDERPK